MRGTRHQQKCVHCGLLNSAFPLGTSLPRCARTAFRQNNSQRGPLCRGAALCSRHTPVITQQTRSEIGSSLGRFRQLLKLLAELVDVVIILLGIGRGGARVPLIVALSILRPTRRVDNIGQLARMGVKHAVTCTLVLASFRQTASAGRCFFTPDMLRSQRCPLVDHYSS